MIDSGLTVTDVDNATLASATVSITGGFQSAEDVLAFTNQNGITGSYNSGTGVLTLTGSSSVANYQAALQTVTYDDTSHNPNTAPRTISFAVNDGTLSSVVSTKTVSMTSVNTAPAPGTDNVITNVGDGTAFAIPVSELLANDTDLEGSALSVTAVALAAAGTSDTVSLAGSAVTYNDTSSTTGGAFTYTVSDGSQTAQGFVTVDDSNANISGGTVTGTTGHDILILKTNSSNTLTVNNVEEIAVASATAQTDTITLGTAMNGGTVDLGAGTDSLTLAAGVNTLTVNNVETVTTGSGATSLTDNLAANTVTVNATALADNTALTLSGAASFTVTGLQGDLTATGVSGALSVTTAAVTSGLSIATGSGSDTINATALTAGQTLTLTGSNAATVTLGTGNLSAGTDTGNLTVTGGTGANTITTGSGNDVITGGTGADTMTGGAGSDTFNFAVGDATFTTPGSTTNGSISGNDVITDFAPGTNAAGSEKIGYSGATVGTTTVTNNSTLELHTGFAITSDNISSGIVTFNDTNGNIAVPLTTIGDVAAAAQFLQANDIGSAGTTEAFTATISGVTHTYIYVQGSSGITTTNTLIDLQNVSANSISAASSQISVIDTTAPTVSTVAYGTNDGALALGEAVTLIVTFSENVVVTGTPTLNLNSGGTASYTSGSGTNALTFTYTPAAGQSTADLALTASAFNLPGGAMITDVAGNTATLTGANSVNPTGTLAVDTTAPTVSSEAITSATGIQNSTLNAGDVASVTVTMSEAVTVTGTPQLALNIGGTTVQANYASGSGSTALVFTYTILSGQTDTNGISIDANALSLNGGTITDAAGNPATLTAALVTDNAGYLVDTTAPSAATITSVTDDVAPVTGTLASGASTNDPNLTVNVNLTGTGAVAGDTVQLYNGTGTGSQLGTSYTLLAADISNGFANVQTGTLTNGTTYAITARITDAAGNQSAVSTNTFTETEDTTAPTVSNEAITSATGIQNSTLNAGDVVSVTVTMSEAVTVNGTPQLALNIGGATVQANYASGTGSTALVFTYTILSGQTDTNGISINANALSLNGGTITDAAGNPATLTFAAVTDNAGYLVDTTAPSAPTISGVGESGAIGGADNTVSGQTGDNTVTGTAEANSTVTVISGANTLGTAIANGSGNWTYTLTSANLTTLGQGNGKSITATATDAAGNVSGASSAFSFSVDTVAPTAVGMVTALSADTGSSSSDFITKTASQTVSGTFTGTLGSGETIQVSADGTTWITATAGSGTWSASSVTLSAGTGTLSVRTIDAAGNTTAGTGHSYTLDTTAPTVSSEAITSATGIQNSELNAGDVASVTVTMSEAVTVTGTPLLQLNIGGTLVNASYASGTGSTALVFTYTILAGQTDTNGISINANALNLNGGTITDAAGNAATVTAAAVTDNASYKVDTTAPTVAQTSHVHNSSVSGTYGDNLGASNVLTVFVDDTTDSKSGNATLNSGAGTWTFSDSGASSSNHLTITATDAAGNQTTINLASTAPAGVSGQPINLALTDLTANPGNPAIVTISGVPADWSSECRHEPRRWRLDRAKQRSRVADNNPGRHVHWRLGAAGQRKLDQCRR